MRWWIIFYVLFSLVACSKKSNLFTTPIRNTVGAVKIVNSDGFIGAISVGTVYEHTFILKAIGGLDIENISVNLTTNDPINFKGGSFPGDGGSCSDTLASGDECTIVIEYAPEDLASHYAELAFSFNDILSTKNYTFNISADSHPILTFEYGSSYDFGNKFIGSTTNLSIKISNTGRVTAENLTIGNLSQPYSYLGGSYPGTGGTCGSRIVPGENCIIVISYAPTNSGQHLQDITLNYLNTSRPESNTLNLLAWGFRVAQLSIASSDGSDSFGEVATNHDHLKTYLVTHSGGDVAANLITLNNITSPFSRFGGTCGTTLTIDQGSCTIILRLNSGTTGLTSNNFNLTYFNGLTNITLNKTITASLKQRPELSFSTSTINFGVVNNGQFATQEITINYQPGGEIAAKDISIIGLSSPFTRDGGTCGSTLSSGSCTMIFKFSPNAFYSWSQNIYITYNNSIGTISSVAINLSGKSQGVLTYSNANLAFGTIVTNETKNLNAQINFSGGQAISNLSVVSLTGPYQFTSGSFPGSTTDVNRCQTTLASGYCRISLTFSPTVAGNFNSTLQLSYFNGIETKTLNLNITGSASSPAILTVSSQDYGSTPVNSAKTGALINIQNGSSVTATSLNFTLPTGFSYRQGAYPGKPGGTCSTNLTLAGNASCKLDIVFTPTQNVSYSDNLTVTYNDGTQSRSAEGVLSGVGTQDSSLYISYYDQVNFSQRYIGQTPQQITLKLGHGGSSETASIQNIASSNSHFNVVSHNCPATLTNGQTCDIITSFTPQSTGALTGSIVVNYQINSSDFITSRNLAGTGISPAVITSTPSSAAFGLIPVSDTSDIELNISKSGSFNTSASVGTITGSGFSFKNGTYPGAGGTCPTSGSFPSSCKVVISFAPTSATNYSGVFKINYNNGFQITPLEVNLTGSGQPIANLNFASASYNFGQIIQTTSTEKILTVTNNGQVDATSLSIASPTNPFQFKGGNYPGDGGNCGSSLSVNASCTLVIVYAPTTTGVTTRTLSLSYFNGVNTTNAQTTIIGEALAQAIVSISDSNPYDFGTTNPGSFIDKTFILTNSGSVNATSIQFSLNSPFSFKDGSYPGTGGNCSSTINAGTSCQMVVSFSPSSTGTYSTNMTLNYNDGLRTQTEIKTLNANSSNLEAYLYLMNTIPNLETTLKQNKITIQEIVNYFPSFEGIYFKKINIQNEKILYLFNSKLSMMAVDQNTQNSIFTVYNQLDQNYQYGQYVRELNLDLDQDNIKEILMGIHCNKTVCGFDILSGYSGRILIRLKNQL